MNELNLRLKLAEIGVMKEGRSEYIVRKLQETRNFEVDLKEENRILRNNVKELQAQLQAAYIRIGELHENKQLELDFEEFYNDRGWKNSNANI